MKLGKRIEDFIVSAREALKSFFSLFLRIGLLFLRIA